MTFKPNIYLGQCYGIYPSVTLLEWYLHQAYRNAMTYTQMLLAKGYMVFSPILQTHPFHVVWLEQHPKDKPPDYVKWDLQILRSLDPKAWIVVFLDDCLTHTPDCKVYVDHTKSPGAYQEYLAAREVHLPVYTISDMIFLRDFPDDLIPDPTIEPPDPTWHLR